MKKDAESNRVEVLVSHSKSGDYDIYVGEWSFSDGYWWAKPSLFAWRSGNRKYNILIYFYPDLNPLPEILVVLNAPDTNYHSEQAISWGKRRKMILFRFEVPQKEGGNTYQVVLRIQPVFLPKVMTH